MFFASSKAKFIFLFILITIAKSEKISFENQKNLENLKKSYLNEPDRNELFKILQTGNKTSDLVVK